MRLKNRQGSQTFELVGGFRKSKALSIIFVVADIVASAHWELRSPSFRSNLNLFWSNFEVYDQCFKVSPTFQ